MEQTQIIGEDWFSYVSDDNVINVGQSLTDTVNIQANSNFRLYEITYFASNPVTGAAITESDRQIPLVTMQLTDTGSGQQLFSDALPVSMIAGTGERPYKLPKPRTFRANTTMTINFHNYSLLANYRLYVAFTGLKIFTPGEN